MEIQLVKKLIELILEGKGTKFCIREDLGDYKIKHKSYQQHCQEIIELD